MSAQRPQAYFRTMENGLMAVTDLLLQNSVDLTEVKELIYGRYRQEDERRATCDAQRREMRDKLANLTTSTAQYHEPSATSTSDSSGEYQRTANVKGTDIEGLT